ncbi:hypothetical protein BKA83DRAFT_4465568 [Pisolithus microcarpus]|nr:hypothetical protein BKA83DRAFT_4465568 [Pisolithus microcarpus]
MVLDRMEQLDVSHAGGEFQELTSELLGDFWKSTSQEVRAKCPDYRTFQDHSAKWTATFSVQLDVMTEAYMAWSLNQGGAGGKGFFDSDERRAEKTSITVGPTDRYLSSALVCHGLIPCSPITPKVAVTVSTLNLYHTARQRCPHLSIQAYVKSLCDMHGVPFYNHHSRQFSIALDVYSQILALVSNLVCQALQRDQPDWRLKHCCPACTYKLQDELAMQFKMLFAQDGNDSLKRVATRHGDGNLCVEHWKNMKDSVTQKMWNVFNETGAFIAVCQHGFCLVIADMVQSGEQTKYALTVTSKLLDAFSSDLGGGYDIGCQFKTTLASSILGERAQSLNYTSLVNAFHGHTHNRLCQLDNLMTYVEGLRLEDLEGCEHTFSKSNALAPSTCYASIFHRRQAIMCYFEHNDEMEVYANLTKFLLNNYKQALDLLSNGRVTLEQLMCELGVSDPTIFRQWLDEEQPAEETLQMEYWQQLVNLAASRQDLETILSTWTVITAQNVAPIWSDSSATRKRETMRRHAQENYEKDLKAVQELEGRLEITRRWVPEDEEWQAATRLVANRKYQCALDNIKRLVVSWIFELSKMNQSGTGYKLRKHIGKALQTHLVAIRAAVTQYNTAAKALGHISTWLWALPAARLAINTHFKLCRAEEEVIRLNVEIRRVITYLIDEDRYLRACEALYQDANPTLAYQISRYHTIRSQFTPLHLCSLEKISRLSGFSGTLALGISVSRGLGDSAGIPQRVEDNANEDADEDHATTLEEQCKALQNILSVTMDP